jgi:CRISPR-associated protein Cmr1
MAKPIPPCPQFSPNRSTPHAHQQYELKLLTPMFGGGVESRIIDVSFPIRPTSIRGQLQFWWRATIGARYSTPQDLREAQSALWGGIGSDDQNTALQASQVRVWVDQVRWEKAKQCAQFEKDGKNPNRFRAAPKWNAPFNGTSLPYALFPFQGQLAKGGQRIEVQPSHFIQEAQFRLSLQFPTDKCAEIETALWAWVNFGGIGARTRRGCGALYCKSLAPQDVADLKAAWQRYMPELYPQRAWPTLASTLLYHQKECANAIDAWDRVISQFRHFRQGIDLGRNPPSEEDSRRPGRSRFPEPETIRAVTRMRCTRHQRISHIPDNAFPRAEFGLPIVFHFKDPGEPPDTTLNPGRDSEGNKRERMASPLILKPLALRSGSAIPIILRLNAPSVDTVELYQGSHPHNLLKPTLIRHPDLANLTVYRNSPLNCSQFLQAKTRETGSALDAFLAYAGSDMIGFKEVTR